MKETTEAIDQMLDLYNDTLRVLSALPDIPPDVSPLMRESLLAMDPAISREETEWLKAHLGQVIATLAQVQDVFDRARGLLGEEEVRKLLEDRNSSVQP